jgi:transaldolase
MTDRLKTLADAGVAIWLDDISRTRLTSGNLADLVANKHVVGVTSNPTIFAKAISDADSYNEQLRTLADGGADVEAAVRAMTSDDIRDACDVLLPAYEGSGRQDGRVSIEVDPRLAHVTDKSIDEAKGLWDLVDRENLFIKIPATKEGLPAITATLAGGMSVNVTLIFSLERYRAVMDAWLDGLEQAKANGHDLTRLASVASFFVSRVDAEYTKRIDKLSGDDAAKGEQLKNKAALANARLAFAAFEEVVAGPRWQALAADGALVQRPLWASTSTKDPSLSDTLYVTELVTDGVVNTMPEPTLNAFADHGELAGDTVRGTADEAQAVIDQLTALGISYDEVVDTLEDEAVEKFEASWNELLETVAKEMAKEGTDS